MKLTVGVINMQSGIGMTKGYRQYFTHGWKYLLPHRGRGLEGARKLLKEESVDVALCTELEEISRRSKFVSHTQELRDEHQLPYAEFFSAHKIKNVLHEGNAVISRFPLTQTVLHTLPSRLTPRVLGESYITLDGISIHVFVVHLGLGSAERKTQLIAIANILRNTKGPIILGGDFNERRSDVFDILKKAGLTQMIKPPNFPSWKPVHALQALFLSKHFSVTRSDVSTHLPFSDHLPLVVELELVT